MLLIVEPRSCVTQCYATEVAQSKPQKRSHSQIWGKFYLFVKVKFREIRSLSQHEICRKPNPPKRTRTHSKTSVGPGVTWAEKETEGYAQLLIVAVVTGG